MTVDDRPDTITPLPGESTSDASGDPEERSLEVAAGSLAGFILSLSSEERRKNLPPECATRLT